MVPMTAMMSILAGLALWRQRGAAQAPAAVPFALPAALPPAFLSAMALAILAAHAARWAPPPFMLHAPPHLRAWALSSPLTATMFAGVGIGLLATLRARSVRHGQWLALGVLLLALLTLGGYVFHDTYLYRLLPGRGTSILTTLVLILLPLGIFGLRPSEGIMVAVTGGATGARIARRLLLSALAMPVLLGAAVGVALHLEAIDSGTAIALLVWGMAALFTAVTWRCALMLYHAEAARRQAEQEREAALASLRDADARKDDFLAVLAHELRNPLAPIRAAADLLRLSKGGDPAQLRRTSDIIDRQVGHMTHLVDDLLDVSRVRRGLLALEKAPLDLRAAVGDALEQIKPLIAQRRHRLQVDLGAARPQVLGDHKRLVQVVANLLANAAKYTPEGGEIVLSLRAADGRAEVSVRDNGIGIDAGLLPQVFDSFTQATRTAGRAEGGLGLGLALVRRLAELHDGRVSAHSAGLGQGSTFVLTLPCLRASAA
ncbi:HAMP domain-containing histidine kinase [Massilia forsythiae]|uniref:histidine kinase n=2 Tax=Massilia forsythiae TaxID=2728020 RepID=A0A7Z2W2R7_9BURK|nr:HAMP domain-containing histidine kinase [Massilia forsythiae]